MRRPTPGIGGRRLRELLVGAVLDCPEAAEGLQAFAAWRALSLLWQTGWLGAKAGSERKVRAQVRRHFREIAAAQGPVAALAQAHPGQVVCLAGCARRGPPLSAPDFLLDDDTADPVSILLAGARIVEGTKVDVGAPVTVLGFFDRTIDPAVSGRVPRRPPWRPVVRSGDTLPLVVLRG